MKRIEILLLLFLGVIVATFFITRNYYLNSDSSNAPSTVITRDTIWIHDTTIRVEFIDRPIPTDSIITPITPEMIPSNCDSLTDLYKGLLHLYMIKRSYTSVYHIDTLNVKGTFNIETQVFENKLDNIKFEYSLLTKSMEVNSTVVKNNWYMYGKTDFKSVDLGIARTHGNYIFTATYNPTYRTVSLGVGYNLQRLKLW